MSNEKLTGGLFIMDRKEAIQILDADLMELQISCEKAKVIAGDLMQDYFGEANPSAERLKFYYQHFSTFSDIIFDYIYSIEQSLKNMLREGEK